MEYQDLLDKLTFMLKESVSKAQEYQHAVDELKPTAQPALRAENAEIQIVSEEQTDELERLENLYQEEQKRQKEILDVMYRLKHYM